MDNERMQLVLNRFARDLIRRKARQLARAPGFSRHEAEDIEQDLTLHLLEKADRFDPSTGHLHAFITMIVERQAVTLLRQRSNPHGRPQSLDELTAQDPAEGGLLEEERTAHRGVQRRAAQESLELAADVQHVLARLPAPLRDVCESLSRCATPAEALQELGIPRRTFRGRLKSIRRHFEAAGLKGYVFPDEDSEPETQEETTWSPSTTTSAA